jgi:hypothetical protein
MAMGKQVFVILFFVGVLGAALYFWAYYQPASRRMDALRTRIEVKTEQLAADERAARDRELVYASITEEYVELVAQWDIEAQTLPEEFNDTRALRHIHRVVYPHTDKIELEFGISEEREGDELWSTTVELSFETSYWQFLSILYNLVQDDLGNRIVNYEFTVRPLVEGRAQFIERLTSILDHVPDDIRRRLQREIAQPEPFGFYMLDVTMEIEYLSQHHGDFLSLDALRGLWEELDALINEAEEVLANVG